MCKLNPSHQRSETWGPKPWMLFGLLQVGLRKRKDIMLCGFMLFSAMCWNGQSANPLHTSYIFIRDNILLHSASFILGFLYAMKKKPAARKHRYICQILFSSSGSGKFLYLMNKYRCDYYFKTFYFIWELKVFLRMYLRSVVDSFFFLHVLQKEAVKTSFFPFQFSPIKWMLKIWFYVLLLTMY